MLALCGCYNRNSIQDGLSLINYVVIVISMILEDFVQMLSDHVVTMLANVSSRALEHLSLSLRVYVIVGYPHEACRPPIFV
jgi:hypothetical protein